MCHAKVTKINKLRGLLQPRCGPLCMQYDLDDNGRLDRLEFKRMLESLGSQVSEDEADAAFEVNTVPWLKAGIASVGRPCLAATMWMHSFGGGGTSI